MTTPVCDTASEPATDKDGRPYANGFRPAVLEWDGWTCADCIRRAVTAPLRGALRRVICPPAAPARSGAAGGPRPLPDGVMTMPEQPESCDEQPEAVRALVGRTITVTEALTGIPNSRPYQLRVTEARMSSDPASGIVLVTGDRLRMDGAPAIRKRGPVVGVTVSFLDGWPEALGLPALPLREWALEAVGLSAYAEHQRAGIAARIVDPGPAYRVTAGKAVEEQAVPGDQVVQRVAEALAEDGMRVDRHADGRTLRLRYDDGRPPVILAPEG
ncbi:hypothetical protein Srubr_26790 [Streptomyces rubradiris]|uniref:Uncharacterized protein n=2 Tax=Streptomyces rubradiris TaxID=285531 RepID=A0ABQ3RAG4_STRRR|nr:hypothetical protein GCM10018792_79150 [Streptomyces rubradiris]GHI52833.1 hypothetical protein Srubr_26790 [Streptomyces rubradiris]